MYIGDEDAHFSKNRTSAEWRMTSTCGGDNNAQAGKAIVSVLSHTAASPTAIRSSGGFPGQEAGLACSYILVLASHRGLTEKMGPASSRPESLTKRNIGESLQPLTDMTRLQNQSAADYDKSRCNQEGDEQSKNVHFKF